MILMRVRRNEDGPRGSCYCDRDSILRKFVAEGESGAELLSCEVVDGFVLSVFIVSLLIEVVEFG